MIEVLVGPGELLHHLDQALTHPSYANERKPSPGDYQRLEFLGDAVIALCSSEHLMAHYPLAREGELSKLRSNVVSTDALASFARLANLGASLRLGKGADAAGEREQSSVLADALEALVGAVYLDRGIEVARLLVEEIVEHGLQLRRDQSDPKSELQELVQSRGAPAPTYRLRETRGPDHQREFVVDVEGFGRILGIGVGRSKKAAEQDAARSGLETLAADDAEAEELESAKSSPDPLGPPASQNLGGSDT